MYFVVAGRARIHIGGEIAETAAPAVACVPLNRQHRLANIGDSDSQRIYVSIWPEKIVPQEGLQWREACGAMIRTYELKNDSAQPKL